MKNYILILSLILSIITACGDSVIEKAKKFVPNNPPVIANISYKTSGGLDVTSAYIVPNNVIKFTVSATDSDGDSLKYTFASETGSFATQTVSGDFCTVDFVIGNITGGQEVRVDITVDDGRGGKVTTYRSPGSSSMAPSVTTEGKNFIKPADLIELNLNSDRNGYFQIVRQEQLTPVPVFDEDEASYYFNYSATGGIKTITVSGKDASTPGRIALSENNKKYYIYIIFRDLLNQTVTPVHEITADSLPPILTTSIPDRGYIKNSGTLSVSSNEPVTVQNISGDAVITPLILPSGVSSFVLDAGVTSGIGKTVAITYSDLAGNTATTSMALNIYDKEVYVKAGSDGNGLHSTPYGNIELAITNLSLGKDEFGAVHVAAGIYSAEDSPVVKIEGRDNIFLIGGYTDLSYDQKTRDFDSTQLTTSGVGYDVTPAKDTPPLSCVLFINSAGCILDGFKMTTISDTDEVESYFSGVSCFESSPFIINNNITGVFIDKSKCIKGVMTYGIYCSLSVPHIQNNRITGLSRNSDQQVSKTYGIYFQDVNTTNKTISVINNSVNGGGFSGYTFQSTGIYLFNYWNSTSLIIRNNTIYAGLSSWNGGNKGVDISINNNSNVNLNIENNIVYIQPGTSTAGINLASNNASYNANIDKNYIFGFTTAISKVGALGTITEGTVFADIISDHFVNETADNYRLIDQGSGNLIPASIKTGGLDGAVNLWGFTTDGDGKTRTGDGTTGWTIGAFEVD